MRTLLLACICMLLGASATIGDKLDPIALSPMQYSCAYLQIDCTGWDLPVIVYTETVGDMGLWGVYLPDENGEDIIFIDPDAPAKTLVHEMAHHVLHKAGIDDKCTSEMLARKVHHAWEGTAYNDDWRVDYACSVT